MSTNIDDVWAEMQNSEVSTKNKVKTAKKSSTLGQKAKGVEMKKKKGKQNELPPTEVTSDIPVRNDSTALTVSAQIMQSKISKSLSALNDESEVDRRAALSSLKRVLFVENTMSEGDYNEIFRSICKSLFKRFADPAEKCRELSLVLTSLFFKHSTDFVPILGYFIPAFMQRMPPGQAYDEEMKVFVYDINAHEEYRRGKAVDRQDKGGTTGLLTHHVVEPSEEVRLLSCKTISSLLTRIGDLQACSILHPYFHELIMYVQLQLRDPYPDLKLEACAILEYLAGQPDFITGMKFYAVALVRALLPVLRHRHAKVRCAAVRALKVCVLVPDRDKRRGAGSEAIVDLVGFREDNVLPVAGFYKADVQINYLAEITSDTSVLVREQVAEMLHVFMTILEDRYDHHTRLLPYLLDMLTDDNQIISNIALLCLKKCGKQYEDDHPEDIIEKRQYGVDGDKRINLQKPFPLPFVERPPIGIRLFVRGNTKRFLNALMNELTNWTSHTRIKSAKLMKLVIVLCEEHLTMEAYTIFPILVKALHFSTQDKDMILHSLLLDVCELLGRYTAPDIFLHYLLPRVRGDHSIAQYGADSSMRIAVMQVLRSMISGVSSLLIPQHFPEIITVLTDPYVIDPDSMALKDECLLVLKTLLHSMRIALCNRGGLSGLETDHFQMTGRLMTPLNTPIRKCFQFIIECLSQSELRVLASINLVSLSVVDIFCHQDVNTISVSFQSKNIFSEYEIEKDSNLDNNDKIILLSQLFSRYGSTVLFEIIENLEIDEETFISPECRVMLRLLECPCLSLYQNHNLIPQLCPWLLGCVENASKGRMSAQKLLEIAADMFILLLSPLQKYLDIQNEVVNECFKYCFTEDIFKTTRLTKDTIQIHINSMKEYLNRIFQMFIFHDQWNQTNTLKRKRLDILLIIFHINDYISYEYYYANDSFNTDKNENEYHHHDQQLTTNVLWTKESMEQYKNTIEMDKNINNIFHTAISDSILPINPEDIRLGAVEVIRRIFLLYGRKKIPIGSVVKGRLLSFRERKILQDNQNHNNSNKVILQSNDIIVTLNHSIFMLLNLLEDSSDNVRMAAILTLHYSLPFIIVEDDKHVEDILEYANDEKNSSIPIVSLTSFLNRLMNQVSMGTSPDIAEALDGLVRSVAVLNPNLVSSIVRSTIEDLKNEKSQLLHAHSSWFSGVLEHCELLVSFQNK